MAQPTAADFNIEYFLGKSLEVYFCNIIPFSLLMALITTPQFFVELQAVSSDLLLSWSLLFLDRLNPLLRLVLPYAAGATLIFGTMQALRGQRAAFGECLDRGIMVLIPVLGVVLIVSLATIVGMVLLVIPGLVVMTMFRVAIPVAVVERSGVIATLRRNSALTHGYRWRLFGIIVVLAVAAGGAGLLIGFVFGGIGAVSVGVTYFALRVVKEGVDIEEIAKVFG